MGKGGYRLGAGRPAQHRKTSNFRHMDVRRLQREGLLKDGAAYGWTWKDADTDEETASIGVRVEGEAVRFVYQIGGEHDVNELVRLTRTTCNYGGGRMWFVCPYCSRRCALVYIGRQVACRKCLKLKYPSQSDDETDASWRRQRKLAAKIGADGNEWLWKQKPKGMHQNTLQRIRGEIIEEESRREALLVARWCSMFGSQYF